MAQENLNLSSQPLSAPMPQFTACWSAQQQAQLLPYKDPASNASVLEKRPTAGLK